MNFQTVVSDVKTRVDALAAQGQELAKSLPETFKQANEVLVSGVQTLVKTETTTAKELLETVKAGIEKAKTDGLKAVVADPISYLPERQKFVTAFNDTVELVTKTGDELYQTFKSGLATNGAPTKAAAAPAKKHAAKKTQRAKKTAKAAE